MQREEPIRAAGLTLLLAALLSGGCSDDPARPETALSGTVEVRNQLGEPVSPEGVRIGTAVPVLSPVTSTGPDGSWVLQGLPPGRHSLLFERAGFGPVALFDVPADSSGLRVVLPERSSVVLTGLDARVDGACGTSPCLDLTVRARSEGFFPPGGRRRVLRLFLGPAGELTERSYARTLTLLVTDDDPALSREGGELEVRFEDVRGVAAVLSGREAPGALVFGATENAEVSYADPLGNAVYPDLSLVGAAAAVER